LNTNEEFGRLRGRRKFIYGTVATAGILAAGGVAFGRLIGSHHAAHAGFFPNPQPPHQALSSGYVWSNVAVGGGGAVPGIVIHPQAPDLIYIHTDIGGIYRWDPTNLKWLPLRLASRLER
jgi:hypothetical protein